MGVVGVGGSLEVDWQGGDGLVAGGKEKIGKAKER